MLLSVIIPCYNVEAYISECLESVCTQELRDLEIICIDDGSTDRTGEILEQWREKDSRIRLFRQENMGPSTAKNAGLRAAQGDYVYYVDSDDRIAAPDILRFCCDTMQRLDLDVLVGSSNLFYTPPELQEKYLQFRESYYTIDHAYEGVLSGPESIKQLRQNGDWNVIIPARIFRRAFLTDNQLSFLSGQLHEDEYFALRSMFLAKRVMITQKVFYHRRIREGSIVTKKLTYRNVKGNLTNYIEGLRFLEAHRDICELDVDIGWVPCLGRIKVVDWCAVLAKDEVDRFLASLTPEENFYYKNFVEREVQKAQEIRRQKKTISDLEKENMAAAQNSAKMSEQIDIAVKQNTALEGKIEAAAKENTALEEKMEAAAKENAALEGKIEAAAKENTALKEKIEAAAKENTALEEKIEAAGKENAALEEKIEAASKENTALEEQLSRLRKQAEAAAKQEKQAKARLQAIQESRSYRLGRLLSWPWRKLKQLLGL